MIKFVFYVQLFFFLILLPTSLLAQNLPKIAVWDLQAANIPSSYAELLTSNLISEIAKIKKYEAISQENIRTVAGWTEQKMMLGCTDTKCLTVLGQWDISKLISGRVGKIGNIYSISLILFDTEKVRQENSTSQECRSEDELIPLIRLAVRELLGAQEFPPTSPFLLSSKGGLLVRSDPPAAEIIIDEIKVGISPFETQDLPPRVYRLRLLKEGFESWEKDIIIEAGKKVEIFSKMKEVYLGANVPQWIRKIKFNQIAPGSGISGLKIGDSRTHVLDILGEPNENASPKLPDGTIISNTSVYRFRNIAFYIFVSPKSQKVNGFRLEDGDFNKESFIPKTTKGPTIGNSLNQLLQAFGPPKEIARNATGSHCPGEYVDYYYYEGIRFCICKSNTMIVDFSIFK